MKKASIIAVICLYTSIVYGQINSEFKHNFIWYFGESNAGLYFNHLSGEIEKTYEHAPLTYEGSNVATHPESGKILFYTSYSKVYDASHSLMPNGNGLYTSTDCAVTNLLCPVPGFNNKYYIFSNTAASPDEGKIYYSIVNMSLVGNGNAQSPLGDIEISYKNVQLINNSSEGFTIVAGPENIYWLILPVHNSTNIRVYLIDNSGINLHNNYNTNITIGDARSVKYSINTGKVAIMNMYEYQKSIVFDFNNETGLISNITPIAGTPMGTQTNFWHGFYDCEWSEDGSKLYMSKYRNANPSTGGRLYQYDLNSLSLSPILIYTVAGGFSNMGCGLKIGPDNKIYYLYKNSLYNDNRIVGVIEKPNLKGDSCLFNPNKIEFNTTAMVHTHKFPEFLPVYKNISIVNRYNYTADLHATVFPNPSNNDFNILINSTLNENLEVTIFNNIGATIYRKLYSSGDYKNIICIDKSIIPNSGIYYLKLRSSNDVFSEKIIKQ